MKNSKISRRKFLGTAAGAAAFTMAPLGYSCTSGVKSSKPNSKVNGVQLGLTTYSYLSIPHNLEEVLGYVLKAGVNALEMRSVLEEGLGIPTRQQNNTSTASQGQVPVPLTDEQKAENARIAAELEKKYINGA